MMKRNKMGETQLHICAKKHEASCNGFLDIARSLVQYGANVNARGYGGRTPVEDATLHNHKELADFLVTSGAKIRNFSLESQENSVNNFKTNETSKSTVMLSGFDDKTKKELLIQLKYLKVNMVDDYSEHGYSIFFYYSNSFSRIDRLKK
ncbi:hypothetical protein MXB_5667 [Myxobolus squamalis]|nr:hypothetical protein MXB_5667 [Myxobolus squamalis]